MGFLSKEVYEMSNNAEYERYIKNHVSNVQRAFRSYGVDLCRILDANFDHIYSRLLKHDDSKTSCEEFTAYRIKFYPIAGESISEQDFNRAWLHHIHNNDHHPEHWIIPTAKGNTILDMPVECIVEMLCDWQSFKYAGKGNAYDFYYKVDKKEGLLSDKTRRLVELALEVFKEDV